MLAKFAKVTFILALVLIYTCKSSVFAQNKHKLWGGIEYGQRVVVADDRVRSNPNMFTGRRYNMLYGMSAVLGYYVSERISLGLGLGIYDYDNLYEEASPIYLDVRYHPSTTVPNLILNAKLGPTLYYYGGDFGHRALFMGNFGVGYVFRWKRFQFVPAISYNILSYRTTTTDNYTIISPDKREFWSQHTIGLRLGIYFQ